ncbi:hypothetical protein ACFQAV_12800 [Companilactobacillus huachuanensis]|uniref:Uncharacterized protein n=1 Tax=Companilactobacillus huachuanensis TaxID=2559914 RepID=A0ABW1RQJ3_9LACO|nr:hypothetical protein [Companilactobacillus huachuanensis]
MSEANSQNIIYDVDLLSKIKESDVASKEKLDFKVKENSKNHYWDRMVTFEISNSPDLKLNKDGVLRFFDVAGNRVGISLNLFERINEISLDSWRN